MRPKNAFILTLIALIIGILVSLVWFFVGTFFLSAFIAGIMEAVTETEVGPGADNILPAFFITLIHNVVIISLLIMALLRTLQSRAVENLKKDGIWILIIGLVVMILHPIMALPSVLVVIAGALTLKAANENVYSITIEKER